MELKSLMWIFIPLAIYFVVVRVVLPRFGVHG